MKIKIKDIAKNLTYEEIKERRWKICKTSRKGGLLRFSDYIVSDRGEVMRITPAINTICGKILSISVNSHGYSFVKLQRNKKSYSISLHKLVLESFNGFIPGKIVHHKTGIKTKNKLFQLEHLFHIENVREVFKNNLSKKQKLTVKKVRKIRKMLAAKISPKEIAEKFGVCKMNIYDIKNGKRWGYI